MLRIGIAFLLGHCVIHCLPELPPAHPWAIALAALLLAAFGCMGIHARGREELRFPAAHRLRLTTHTLAAILLGIAWAWSNAAQRLESDLPAGLEGRDVVVRGFIASIPEVSAADIQFLLDVDGGMGLPPRIQLAWYDAAEQPAAGELWQFTVRLKRRNGFANPGGFDYEGYLFRNGIGASGYVRQDTGNSRIAAASARYPVLRLRAWIARRIDAALGNHAMLGMVQGLAVGVTHAVSADQWRALAATGTTHLMAISGLHVGLLAGLGAWLGGTVSRWRRAQRLRLTAFQGQAVGGIGCAAAYALLAGLSVPTQRALVMLAIYFGARWCRRELRAGSALGVALIGVLLIDPFVPLGTGTWLSFGAVAAIVLGTGGRLDVAGPVKSFGRVQFAVILGLAPLLIAAFGSLSLVAPLANAIAVPLFSLLLVPLVLAGALLSAVWLPAGSAVLGPTATLMQGGWPMLQWCAQLPIATVYFPQPSVLAWLLLAGGAWLLLLPGIWPLRVVGALLCLPALLAQPVKLAAGEYQLALLDVGQGLAVVIRTRSHVLVYDSGPAFRSGRDTGELVVLPYLRSQGMREIDMLMISHGDLDHRGGMRSILAGMTVEQLSAGPSVRAPAPAEPCVRGQHWIWDEVEFAVLHPVEPASASDNDTSCVLRITGKGGSALLTGDIQSSGEAQLLSAGLDPVDVLIVPHHGSATSSTPAFVEATAPRLALVAAGYANRWGFPKPLVSERWRQAGAKVFATGEMGAIEVRMTRSGMQPPRHYRHAARHYWWR